jgi:uncharacterized membrane protein YfcA
MDVMLKHNLLLLGYWATAYVTGRGTTMAIQTVVAVVIIGAVSGFLNTLAAGGNAVALPAMIALGVHAHIANGSNRIALFVSCITRLIVFQRARVIDWRKGLMLTPFVAVGSVLGAVIEHHLRERSLDAIIAGTLALTLVLILAGTKRFLQSSDNRTARLAWWHAVLCFLIGAWGGFIAVDSALFFLLVFVLLVGEGVVAANALKAWLMLIMSMTSVATMIGEREVSWTLGVGLSAGSVLGSWIGAKVSVHENSRFWVYRLLLAVVVGELIWVAWTLFLF